MVSLEFVNYKLENYLGRITLNRPPVNALSRQVVQEIRTLAEVIDKDVDNRRVRVVILEAMGKHFCAGADLKERKEIPEKQVEQVVQGIRNAVEAIAAIRVPTIAAVLGSAIGGGMELALAADIRILADDAKMGLRETALAIIPGAGGTQRLPRLIGYARAVEWIATASLFDAETCWQQGVANRVVPAASLREEVTKMAEGIAANGPLAVRYAKEAMRSGLEVPLPEALELEWQHYRRTIPTKDRREALQAFAEKRLPKFKGE